MSPAGRRRRSGPRATAEASGATVYSTSTFLLVNSGNRPCGRHLLRNCDFLRYFLDHVEFLPDTELNPDAIAAVMGLDGGGLWDRVARPAYLESDTPHGWPFTGRQWSNHEVWRRRAGL
jgi:hypothetical protein